jgi:orotate phosphoribosyltransferase
LAVEVARATSAEGGLDGRITSLEADHFLFNQEVFTITSGDISNGYIDLGHEVEALSLNMYVDRLAIHQTADYTVSVVAGALLPAGEEALAAGDVIRAKYAYRV